MSLEGAGVGLAAAGPYVLKRIIDALSDPKLQASSPVGLIAVFVSVWTATNVLTAARNVYSTRLSARIAQDIALAVVAGFLEAGTWRRLDASRVHSRLERLPPDLNVILDGLVWRALPLMAQLALSVGIIVGLMSWTYGLLLLLFASAFVIVTWIGLRRQFKAAQPYSVALSESGSLIGDVLRNAQRVVSNGATAFELTGLRSLLTDRARKEGSASWSLVQLTFLQWAVMTAGLGAMLALAALDVHRGTLTAGDFVLLQAYGLRLMAPLSSVAFSLSQCAAAFANLEDLFALEGEASEAPMSGHFEGEGRAGELTAEHVSFAYGQGKPDIHDATVRFPPTSFSVIVGKNGAGKSTLAQLLAGQLSPSSGTVRINGVDLSTTRAHERIRLVMYAPQRTSLLNRSLRANLLYPPAPQGEAASVAALTAWQFHDDGAPILLDAPVGEQGAGLSGGQVQKLELARLLAIRTPCVVLDESTSALDPASEARVIGDLRQHLGARTTLILVTHRAALAKAADQVVWMQAGRVKAIGSHDELMTTFAEYEALWGAAS